MGNTQSPSSKKDENRLLTPSTSEGSLSLFSLDQSTSKTLNEVFLTAQKRKKDLEKYPRIYMAHLPTPLEFCPRLSKELGGVEIYIKRDDCTGLATGGNKARKLGERIDTL